MKKFAILQKTEVVTVSLLSLVLFLRMFSIFLVLPVFNILAQEVKYANFFLVALAFGIYGLTQGLCQLPAGYFSDVWGRKRYIEQLLKNEYKQLHNRHRKKKAPHR